MDWMDTNGACLRYDLSGEGAETLVLVHEMGGSIESWDHVIPTLRRSFRVLRFDMRGAGLSEKPRGSIPVDTMAGDIEGLLDGLGIGGKVAIMGAALGCAPVLRFASTRPDRVSRLVLCNIATWVDPDRRAMIETRADEAERLGMRAISVGSLGNSYPQHLRDAAPERYRQYRARWIGNDPHGFAAINRMLRDMDMSEDYARIACPTLVVAGIHDKLRPPAVVEPYAKRIPGARFVAVDSGHFMAVQTPELMLETVLPFLQGA